MGLASAGIVGDGLIDDFDCHDTILNEVLGGVNRSLAGGLIR